MATMVHHGTGTIVTTLVVAMILTVMPLPEWIVAARPEFVALFIIYWCIAVPNRFGVGRAWLTGLVLDALLGGVLGQHALALTVVSYLSLKLHLRIRIYPLWQQALSILVLITIYQLLLLWTSGIIGKPATSWTYWLPALSSMLIWPMVFSVLHGVKRNFDVS